jgi:hypothetical protein
MVRNNIRLIAAFFVAPTVATMFFAIFLSLLNFVRFSWQAGQFELSTLAMAFILGSLSGIGYGAFVGYPAMLLLGLPLHILLYRSGRRSVAFYVMAGAFVGFVAIVIAASILWLSVLHGNETQSVFSDRLELIVTFAITTGVSACVGALAGCLSWLIRRPDRDPPNPVTQSP